MKFLIICMIPLMFWSCNLAKWNQKRLDKKLSRNGLQQNVFQNEAHKIHYFSGGEGETVLLIHGFGGDAQITWYKTMLDLVKDYHIIAPDLLWFGKSESTKTPELATQVDAIYDLLDHLGVEKCKIVGISYGGFVSMGMLYEHPDRVEKLAMVDSPGVTYDVSLLNDLCEIAGVDEIQDIFVVKSQEDVKRLFEFTFYNDKMIPKKVYRDAYELYFSNHHDKLHQLLETILFEKDRLKTKEPANFPPTVVIWGEHDQVFPLSEGKKLADFIGAELKIIPKSGHAPNLENFKVFEKQLRTFLDKE
ncbi:MAG: alpha/beta hydrolase [Crocinitomicaceae bacterium]